MAKQRHGDKDAARTHLNGSLKKNARLKNARQRLAAALEILEIRRLLASVSGHVFVDPDPDDPGASHTYADGDTG